MLKRKFVESELNPKCLDKRLTKKFKSCTYNCFFHETQNICNYYSCNGVLDLKIINKILEKYNKDNEQDSLKKDYIF